VNIARFLLSIAARLFPDALFYHATGEKIIALTIDDLPTPNDPGERSSLRILEAIARHNCRYPDNPVTATVFLITGHFLPDATFIDRLLADGHESANHGTRDLQTSSLSPEEFARELQTAHEFLTRHAGISPRWYRPGRALYNGSMRSILRSFPGYDPRFALASMVPLDTNPGTDDPRFTLGYVSRFIFPGAILVLHGGSQTRDANTAIVLETLLKTLYHQGYRVVTLSELIDTPLTE
jgi:peptidoglycan-N-acetylglucosamine deacetylase